MGAIATAELFDSVWKIFTRAVEPNVREFDAIHLQFDFSGMFELDKFVREF